MMHRYSFGKVDGYRIGRKNCEVTLEAGFREYSGQEAYFSVCGNLWNNLHTDIIQGGQCIDSLAEEYKTLRHNGLYMMLFHFWKKYHLKKYNEIPAMDRMIIEEILAGAKAEGGKIA